MLRGMLSEKVPVFSKLSCDNKWWMHKLFESRELPVPHTEVYRDMEHAKAFVAKHKNIVVKPRSGAHGFGVQLNISNDNLLNTAVAKAKEFEDILLLQQQVGGRDLRILVVGNKIISAVERKPASVVGDGLHSVRELIKIENTKEERGEVGIDALVKISEPAAKAYLTSAQLEAVPLKDEEVRVVGPSNQSLGGRIVDALDSITPELHEQVTGLVAHLKMPIAGVDVILGSTQHYFIEVNASPGIWIHDDNFAGVTSGCFGAYAKLLHEDTF